MSKVTYTIPAINCNHCIHTIKTELSDLNGVQSVDANLDNKKVTVAFESPATEEQIVSLLTEINYPPEK